MTATMEAKMVTAHKAGRSLRRKSKAAQIVALSNIENGKMFDTAQEREAYLAGYLGEERRANIARYAARRAEPCRWFLRCDNPATTTVPHPILGAVPCCDRCAKFATS